MLIFQEKSYQDLTVILKNKQCEEFVKVSIARYIDPNNGSQKAYKCGLSGLNYNSF